MATEFGKIVWYHLCITKNIVRNIMEKLKLSFISALTLLILLVSCKQEDIPTIAVENEVNTFIWSALNSWYYWQSDVSNLRDDRFDSKNKLNTFLNGYTDPNLLFEDLKYPDDRFSWIVDDYQTLDQYFAGVTTSFGFKYGLVRWSQDSVLGYAKYVVPESPASEVGLKRGDLFYAVNGQNMMLDNYSELLKDQEGYQLSLAKIENSLLTPTEISEAFFAIELTENPILLTKIIEIEGTKIGYLMYNGFKHTFHKELNEAFGTLKEAGIDELVLDLRYNSGGSIYTSMHLASMIYGDADASNVFCKIVYNDAHGGNSRALNFVDNVDVVNSEFESQYTLQLNELAIDRMYVLVSSQTASASELIIAGLLPYMEVILIGNQTVGKNEASRTLYDSPSSDFTDNEKDLNPNHTWAVQPIISKLANSLDFSDYSTGFIPDIEARESDYLEFMKPLGDDSELLLSLAIDEITGRNALGRQSFKDPKTIVSELTNKFAFEMHLNGIY
jgi:carboxyl-terminal processing protease